MELTELLERNTEQADAIMEKIYSKTVELADNPALTELELDTLRKISTQEMLPTRTLVGLVDNGYIGAPTRLRDGRWRAELTDKGTELLNATSEQSIDIDAILA